MADEGWIRPASAQEIFSENSYRQNTLLISYVARVATSRELTEDDARKVFTSLQRKTPNLRMGLHERDGKLWLRDMRKDEIDFEMLPNADPYKVYHEMSRYHYNADGPFWAARFLPWSSTHTDFVSSTTMEPNDEQKDPSKHPYVNHIAIAYHHGITDGHTCMWTLRNALSLFDDVIAGRFIDDSVQFAEMIDTRQEIAILDEIEQKFRKSPELLKARKESFDSCLVEILLEQAYPIKPRVKPETFAILYNLDSNTSKMFTARCKKEGVTFHTGFSSVIEATLIKLMMDKKVERDPFTISSIHAINQRSYYSKGSENFFGCGMGVMDLTVETPKDVLDNFWEFARYYHSKFKDQHARKTCMEHHVIEKLTGTSALNLLDIDGVDVPIPKMTYYCTTNMLEVTKVLGNIGEHIVMEYYDRLTSMHLLPTLWMSTFQSFRGQLMHSLQYNVHLMGTEAAQKISDTIFEVLAKVAES